MQVKLNRRRLVRVTAYKNMPIRIYEKLFAVSGGSIKFCYVAEYEQDLWKFTIEEEFDTVESALKTAIDWLKFREETLRRSYDTASLVSVQRFRRGNSLHPTLREDGTRWTFSCSLESSYEYGSDPEL